MSPDTELIATRNITITNAPGSIPSTTQVVKGQRFFLDGDEPIHVDRLFARGVIQEYTGTPEQIALRTEGRAIAKKKAANPFRRKKRI